MENVIKKDTTRENVELVYLGNHYAREDEDVKR